MIRRSKKVRKQRGGRHHGWGPTTGHRGKGIRGGTGGLKSHKKIAVIKQQKLQREPIIGKLGFKRPQRRAKPTRVMNVSHVSQAIKSLLAEGIAEEKGGKIHVDLHKLGVEKLLAQGKVSQPLVISVKSASERAIEKIKEAGGEVLLPE